MLLLLATACSGAQSNAPIDRIELSQSGPWSGVAIEVTRQGAGTHERTNGPGGEVSGSFVIAPQEFQRLQSTLEPFRRKAVPYSAQNVRAYLTRSCPKGAQFTTDQGVFWVRWVSRSTDQLYFADLGCDPAHNAKRNSQLLNMLNSFPVHGS